MRFDRTESPTCTLGASRRSIRSNASVAWTVPASRRRAMPSSSSLAMAGVSFSPMVATVPPAAGSLKYCCASWRARASPAASRA